MWHGKVEDGGRREKMTVGGGGEGGEEKKMQREWRKGDGERLHDTQAYNLDRNKSRLRPDFKEQDYKN